MGVARELRREVSNSLVDGREDISRLVLALPRVV
jgi:hypothetical protein